MTSMQPLYYNGGLVATDLYDKLQQVQGRISRCHAESVKIVNQITHMRAHVHSATGLIYSTRQLDAIV